VLRRSFLSVSSPDQRSALLEEPTFFARRRQVSAAFNLGNTLPVGNSGSSLALPGRAGVVVLGVSVVACCVVYAVGGSIVRFVALGEVGCTLDDVLKHAGYNMFYTRARVAAVVWMGRGFVVRFVA
jgi:hypothetical protein